MTKKRTSVPSMVLLLATLNMPFDPRFGRFLGDAQVRVSTDNRDRADGDIGGRLTEHVALFYS